MLHSKLQAPSHPDNEYVLVMRMLHKDIIKMSDKFQNRGSQLSDSLPVCQNRRDIGDTLEVSRPSGTSQSLMGRK